MSSGRTDRAQRSRSQPESACWAVGDVDEDVLGLLWISRVYGGGAGSNKQRRNSERVALRSHDQMIK